MASNAMSRHTPLAVASAHIQIHCCVQDDESLGAPDTRMASRVVFDVVVLGRTYPSCWVEVSQSAGGDYATEPIDIGPLVGCPNPVPWKPQDFAHEIERYYRSVIGPHATGVWRSLLNPGGPIRSLRHASRHWFELPLTDTSQPRTP